MTKVVIWPQNYLFNATYSEKLRKYVKSQIPFPSIVSTSSSSRPAGGRVDEDKLCT